ncbi:hypothetical protein APHAL10511_004161 [Amanita phalloides]|nr:hypothetical protein APHAL10511_004161 [Amanita phalloides]
MLFAEGEDHRRQRRALSPAFSNVALRTVTSVFYDSAYKVKANWRASFESTDEAIIDVQKWMGRITLDSVGIAGFGHDFKALEGQESPIFKVFQSFNTLRSGGARRLFILLGPIFPQIVNMPTERSRMFRRMRKATSEIASHLLEDSVREKESSQNIRDESILGLLGTYYMPFMRLSSFNMLDGSQRRNR